MVSENLFQNRNGKRLYSDDAGGTAVQRFFVIHKYVVHQWVYWTTNNQIHTGIILGGIPDILNVAKYRVIDSLKFLEFINNQVVGLLLAYFHHVAKQVTDIVHSVWNEHAKWVPYNLGELPAQHVFIAATDE